VAAEFESPEHRHQHRLRRGPAFTPVALGVPPEN